MKKRYLFFTGVMSGILVLSLFGCGKETASSWYDKDIWMTKSEAAVENVVLPASGNFGSDVAVHDPSVFYDIDSRTYYAFGTHFATATSTDLITWTQYSNDNEAGKLYGNAADWKSVLKESIEWTEGSTGTTWAPDVMKIGNKYYMYYSLTTKFGSSTSVIGRVSSSKVTGPYQNEEIIVKSSGKNGSPNCIDPELFYDKDGKLFMVYGSHYAGIFIKELNEKGLPVVTDEYEDDYYGTLVWKGDPAGKTVVEGPFVFYHAESDYYYLMTTYGDLSTDYNMRIARSKSPMGPYTDIGGNNMASAFGNGNKMAGNYRFAGDMQRKALGHNSVVKVDGKYLVVCHARNVQGAHHVEVHQLFFNESGWPVMSPNRYVGETIGKVTQSAAAGDYDVIVHTEGTSAEYVSSVKFTLTEDGRMTSAEGEVGTWSVSGDYYVTITLGDTTYNGVVAPGWRQYGTAAGVLCMTATTNTGAAIWLNAAV